jgi:hypothetical protein
MAILVVCQCGKRFKADDNLAGSRGECPACKQEIVFQRQSTLAFEPEHKPPPIPLIQTSEEISTLIEATNAKRHLGPATVALSWTAIVLLVAALLAWLAWPQSGGDELVRSMGSYDYRACLLKLEYARTRDDPARPYAPLAEANRKHRELWTDWISQMPPGDEWLAKLYEASTYFEGELLESWIGSLSVALHLADASIVVAPKDVLSGSLEVMMCWGPAALKSKVAFQTFGRAYERRRIEMRMSHDRAINDMAMEVIRFKQAEQASK